MAKSTTNKPSEPTHKVVYGIVKRGDREFWNRIGAAFVNKDGSFTVALDFVPTDPTTTIHIRDPKPQDKE